MLGINFVRGWDVAQVVEHSPVKVASSEAALQVHFAVWANFCSNQWSTTGPSKAVVCAVCPVCGKVHVKDPLLFIRMSSLCGDSRFRLKKYVTMTMRLTTNSR